MSETPETEKPVKDPQAKQPAKPDAVPEFGGQKGPDPTRYGDWEKNGRVSDF